MLIFMMMCIGLQKEEIYDYQIGLIITQENEDFMIAQQDFAHPENQYQKTIKYDEKVVLLGESNHSIDHIIDMKQNQFQNSYQVWVLYKIGNQSILSKIIEDKLQENYYLHLNYECYTFYFIAKLQIIIDCQNQGSNIIVLYDIQHKIQQSYFYFYYKELSFRKLLQIQYDTFVLIQQEKLIILCRQSNKYQMCNQIDFQNNAHTVYAKLQEIFFISDQHFDVFEINIENTFEIIHIKNQNFSELGLHLSYPILYYYNQYEKQFFIQPNYITICEKICQNKFFEGHPVKINTQQNQLIIQTNCTMVIIGMPDQKIDSIYQIFENHYIAVNIILKEFWILNKFQLKLFGTNNREFFRIKNQKYIIDYLNPYYNLINKIYSPQDTIIFDQNFQFKLFSDFQQANSFVIVGGLLDISFIVEDKYKNLIGLHHNYFKTTKYQKVQYFWINNEKNIESIIVLYQDRQTLYNQTQEIYFSTIDDSKNLQLIQSFNDAYLMLNTSNGLKFIMIIVNNSINFVKYDCSHNSTLLECNNKLCICQSDNQIFIKKFHVQPDTTIVIAKYEKYIGYDVVNRILYLVNDNQLIIKYAYSQKAMYVQSIKLCLNFINIVVLQYKLVLVCEEQMTLYNKISNHRYFTSGNIELYGSTFAKSLQIIQNDDNLFYIIDNQTLHVFNSNLPLTQFYVTKMQIDKFDDVKSQNQHICFQLKQNLMCYYYQINIKFTYDDDLVEYHQVFKVDVCGENLYNKKCRQYTTRLDQKNRKISIKRSIQQYKINGSAKEIVLDKSYFSGSIEKIFVNNSPLKPKFHFYDFVQINEYVGGIYYYGFDGFIYMIVNKFLLIYQIETRQVKRLTTSKKMRNILKYSNYFLMIGQYSISLVNCDFECKEIKISDRKIIQNRFLHIYNNTLYSVQQTSLRTQNVDDIMKNYSNHIDKELFIYQIDMSQDLNGQMCMVYIDFNQKLVFSYLEKKQSYNISDFFDQQGVYINSFSFNHIYSIKLLDNCKLVLICANFGSYFIQLSTELKQISQVVINSSLLSHLSQLLIGQKYLFYIQQFPDSISIYKFTYYQIYNSKQIDLYSKIQTQNGQYDQKVYYFYAQEDQLYMIYKEIGELRIYKVNLDMVIQMEPNINKIQELQITLINSEETKSFILEVIFEESYEYIVYGICMTLLITVYTYLIYSKIRENA